MSFEDKLYPLLATYQAMPDWMQRLAGGAYRCLPQSWRLGAAYGEFQQLIAESESWSPTGECITGG